MTSLLGCYDEDCDDYQPPTPNWHEVHTNMVDTPDEPAQYVGYKLSAGLMALELYRIRIDAQRALRKLELVWYVVQPFCL